MWLATPGERSREQSVAATEVNCGHSALHAHFGENLPGIGPQRVPPFGIGHRGCREKPVRHAATVRIEEFFR